MLDSMLKSGKQWKIVKDGIMLLCILVLCSLGDLGKGYAKEQEPLENIIVVENEQEMIQILLKGMREHQDYFLFYYPGIHEDFKKYCKGFIPYADFWGKLEQRDGYLMGIVSDAYVTLCDSKDTYVMFQFDYFTTRRQEKVINKKVKAIVRKIGRGSRAIRAKKAHDYLIKHIRYDSRYYNPYYAFTKGRGVCMSYALAYQRILQEMKIPCIYVKGKNHAWNMVKIGSYWYNVDVTWDDAEGGNRYFLKADSDFPGHKRPALKWLDSLPKAEYSYKKK